MGISNKSIITKIHLVISVFIVVPVSIVYGFNPSFKFDIHLNTIDEHNFFKAIMGLYLGFSALWILGVFKVNYLKLALVTNVIFMLGLGFGRVLSVYRWHTYFWLPIWHICRVVFRILWALGVKITSSYYHKFLNLQ